MPTHMVNTRAKFQQILPLSIEVLHVHGQMDCQTTGKQCLATYYWQQRHKTLV